jgi:diguanylate cyclase (GGDEF)-like protein
MARQFAFDDCWALRRGQMHALEQAGKGPVCAHFTSAPDGASLCQPLVIHGDTFGLFHLRSDAEIDRNAQLLAARFGDVLKIGLADLKLRDRLRIQAIRDPLTGLFNRQYLEETLPRECQLAHRRKTVLSVAMLDIDHFKQINDKYGHEAGDEILNAIGALLRAAVRSSDIACRYGGEEFVLVLLDTNLSAAVPRLEEICAHIKGMQRVYRGRTLPSITVSAGVSEFPRHGQSPADIIRAADKAMYAAKTAGRDRVVAHACPKAHRAGAARRWQRSERP